MLKPKVLVVDDKQGQMQFYAELVADEAFDVRVVETTTQALQLLKSDSMDIIIADIAKLSDREALSGTIKTQNLPTIWASGFEELEFEEVPMPARLLNKPFKHVDLRIAIKSEFWKAKRRFDTI